MMNIRLTQNDVENPEVIEGHGRIVQAPNGKFKIVMPLYDQGYNVFNPPPTTGVLANSIKSGQELPASVFFKMDAEDAYGKTWSATNVEVGTDGTDLDKHAILTCMADSLTSDIDLRRGKYECFVFLGKHEFKLSTNSFSDYGEHGKLRNRSILKTKNLDWEITNLEKYIQLHLCSNENISEELINKALMALEIATGYQLHRLAVWHSDGNICKQMLHSPGPLPNSKRLLPPIIESHPSSIKDVELLLSRLVSLDIVDLQNTHNFWLDVFKSSNAAITAWATSLAIALEGLVNAFFRDMTTDQEFRKLCEEAEPVVRTLKGSINERVYGAIWSYLRSAGKAQAKNALKALLPEGELKAWDNIRHRAAHGELNIMEDIGELPDHLFKCQSAFYRLIAHCCGYEGNLVNYGVNGWQTVPVGLQKKYQ